MLRLIYKNYLRLKTPVFHWNFDILIKKISVIRAIILVVKGDSPNRKQWIYSGENSIKVVINWFLFPNSSRKNPINTLLTFRQSISRLIFPHSIGIWPEISQNIVDRLRKVETTASVYELWRQGQHHGN